MYLQQRQIQQLKMILTPKMIQRFKLLQLSYPDLLSEVLNQAKENVLIDVVREDALFDHHSHKKESEDFLLDEFSSLESFLLKQLEVLYLSDKENVLVQDLISHLDDRGYLHLDEEQFMQSHHISLSEFHHVLHVLQSLEPEGVGARTLQECLLLQLEAQDFESDFLKRTLSLLIKNHLQDIADKNDDAIANALSLESKAVATLVSYLQHQFNPNPGSKFCLQPQFLIPSFEVILGQDNALKIINLENKKGIQFNLSQRYMQLLKDPATDDTTRLFLEEKYQQAKEWLDVFQQRQQMMDELIQFLTKRQYAFFRYGLSYLEPLLQKEISTALGLSPSSVSRILSNKSVKTPHGIFLLKQLCPRRYFGHTSQRFKVLLSDVFSRLPHLSDEKISHHLKREGIHIARRTVNKYRQLLNVSRGKEASKKIG